MQNISRRTLIGYLRNFLLSAAGAPLITPKLLRAETAKDDHYFIFVELKGGVHHLLSTDYPEPAALAEIEKNYPDAVLHFTPDFGGQGKGGFLDDVELDDKWKAKISSGAKSANTLFKLNGYFAALPYVSGAGGYFEQYQHGTTQNGGYRYRLGWSGFPLAGIVDELSVLRGVYMLADFHGRANGEIYSGHADGAGPHVAGVLSQLLAKKYGHKPLDNLVLDGAAYSHADSASAVIKLSFQALNALATSSGRSRERSSSRSHLEIITKSLLQQTDLKISADSRIRINQYLSALADADKLKYNLSKFATGDLSLNLRAQLDSCLALIKSGMSRVVTVCTGQKNATNKVDPFGLFDSHSGLYHAIDSNVGSSTRHHRILRAAMQSLADFITDLKHNPLHAAYRDKITLVVSSEFGRPANFFGNENAPKYDTPWKGAVGNGHYYFNNNYLFYGKGVKRGVWLGESDTITRYPFCVDFAKLNAGERDAFIDPIAPQSRSPRGTGTIKLQNGFAAGSLSSAAGNMVFAVLRETANPARRAFMAKDAVKTIMAIAGQSSDVFHGEYRDGFYDDAQLIAPLVD